MTLKSAIGNGYIDHNGLVSPSKGGSSGNGVMYSSEFICLLEANGELTGAVAASWITPLTRCFVEVGLLARDPKNEAEQEGPDDYIALAAAACAINRAIKPLGMDWPIANDVLRYGLRHFGNFNNKQPGKFSWSSWLWRQPQLIAAYMAAAVKRTWYARLFFWIIAQPFYFVAAGSIAVSCRKAALGDADSRRLAWSLIQSTAPVSWMVRLAARGWYARLYADYEDGMKGAYAYYYEPGHPFHTYAKDGYPGEEMP